MKRYNFLTILAATISVFVLCSFAWRGGGDVFAIYYNGKQVHRQFVHIDQSVKALQLQASGENDKIEVLYSHCGQPGTNRTLALRNAQNELIKELKFGNGESDHSLMTFYPGKILKAKNLKINLYYTSTELPEGKLLATILWADQKAIAKR